MLLLLALLAQTAPTATEPPDDVVSVTRAKDDTYMLAITTAEGAEAAIARLKTAADETCKDKGAPYVGLSMVSERKRSKQEKKDKKPVRRDILQFITCGVPQPKPKS